MVERREAWRIAILGILHALLFLLAYLLVTSAPGREAGDAELLDFYAHGDKRRVILAGLYVMPFAGIAFLWFAAMLRARLLADVPRDGGAIGTVQLASAILYVGLFFAGAAASAVTAVIAEYGRLDAMAARPFPAYGGTLILGFGMRMAAMFVATSSRLGVLAGLFPRWFAWLGIVVGCVLLFSASTSRALVLLFPGWQLAVVALLLVRASRAAPPAAKT